MNFNFSLGELLKFSFFLCLNLYFSWFVLVFLLLYIVATGGDSINYYNEIKNNFIDDEIYSKVKDYSKEQHRIETYYKNGKLLNEAGNHYGEKIIKEYSEKLMKEVNKKYNERTLRRMRQFYRKFSNIKWSTLSTKLSWSHYTELLPIKNENEMFYYYNLCIDQCIGVRNLRERIKSNEYERLPESTKNKLINKDDISIEDNIKNPIIIRNNGNEIVSEKILQKLILEDIMGFMKELGEGYSFIGNEYKIKIGDRYNYIDLLFFNYIFNSFVVVELKVTELKKEHIGQIEIYMNYIDNNLKSINNNKTIGIIICRKDNQFVIEYSTDPRIISREYKIIDIK